MIIKYNIKKKKGKERNKERWEGRRKDQEEESKQERCPLGPAASRDDGGLRDARGAGLFSDPRCSFHSHGGGIWKVKRSRSGLGAELSLGAG